MNPLLMITLHCDQILAGLGFGIIGFGIGFSEWFLALQRTAYFMEDDENGTARLVWVEGLWVWLALSNFLLAQTIVAKIIVALLTATGGALAAKLVVRIKKRKSQKKTS